MKILPNNIAVLEGDNWVSRWCEETGRLDHDQNALPHILKLIHEGDTVIDAGAYIGDHTIAYLRAVGPTGAVIAIEPNKAAYDCLRHNCPDALCLNIALSDRIGEMALEDAGNNPGAASLKVGTGVRTTPLDDLKLEKLSFYKLDVEGWEPVALRGSRLTLRKFHPVLCIEINRCALLKHGFEPNDIFAELRALGYTWRNVYEEQKCEGDQYDIIAQSIH